MKASDIGKVLIAFKLCAWSTWVVFVPICGKLKPLRRLARMSGPQKLKAAIIRRYPNRIEKFEEHVLKSSEWFARHKAVRWIPEFFGQKHRDFGLSIAEATVLYKILFPIWAPLEFLYIVRFYKAKWGMADLFPPASVGEYSDSLTHASGIDIFRIAEEENGISNGEHNNKDSDDRNNRNNGSGGGAGGGGTSNAMKARVHANHQERVSAMSVIHTCSSSLSHLIALVMEQRDYLKQQKSQREWSKLLYSYRYGASVSLNNFVKYSQILSLLTAR